MEIMKLNEEFTTIGDYFKTLVLKTQPCIILGNRNCFIELETNWDAAKNNDPMFGGNNELQNPKKHRVTLKFNDSSETHFTIHGQRDVALSFAPAFVQEIVELLPKGERIVWSFQDDDTIHITQVGRYKNIDMLYPDSLENKILGCVGLGKRHEGKTWREKFKQLGDYFFAFDED